jgi:hypothetical protein
LTLDPKWRKFESGINIPDPQHCQMARVFSKKKRKKNFIIIILFVRTVPIFGN